MHMVAGEGSITLQWIIWHTISKPFACCLIHTRQFYYNTVVLLHKTVLAHLPCLKKTVFEAFFAFRPQKMLFTMQKLSFT